MLMKVLARLMNEYTLVEDIISPGPTLSKSDTSGSTMCRGAVLKSEPLIRRHSPGVAGGETQR